MHIRSEAIDRLRDVKWPWTIQQWTEMATT